MSYILQELKCFPISLGGLTICLSGYQLSGSSTLKEAGAADGSVVLSGYWEQGIRLKLKGRLSPDHSPENVILALTQNMLIAQTCTIGKLSFQNAMLCGYTLSDQQDTPEIQLLFYCPENPILQEDA